MKPGEKVGDYIVTKPISVGETGQADIYLAERSDGSGEPVVIKILADHLKHDAISIKNFEKEAELLTQLNHRNIVRIVTFDTSLPTPYIVQEYIEGSTVAKLLEKGSEPLAFDTILQIALQVVDALSYAHSLEYFRIKETKKGGKTGKKNTGIIHRDLSTDNILITENGEAKLIDFGIARAVGIRTITTGTGIGKEFYVAPEVELGNEVVFSPAVDVYSFGVCLFEMVMTGRPEKKRINVLKQFQRNFHHLNSAFPNDVPENLRRLIIHCVQREAKDRPQGMEEVKESLLQIQEQLQSDKTDFAGIPDGLTIQPEILTFDRLLKLPGEYTGDHSIRFSLNEEETRIFLLCNKRTKVDSFNFSGGEKQVHHVPRGKELTVLAGAKGDQALGVLADREGFLLLDEAGEWHTIKKSTAMAEPKAVPDSLILSGKSMFIGDYAAGKIHRLHIDSGDIVGTTPGSSIVQLGPFGISGNNLFFIDMVLKVILQSDLQLNAIKDVAYIANCGWPISLAVKDDLLLILDSQNKSVCVLTDTGNIVHHNALTWGGELAISQIVFSQRTSHLIALENSIPCLIFFHVKEIDREILELLRFVRDSHIEGTGLTYEAIEGSVLSYLRKSHQEENFFIRFVDTLKKYTGSGEKGVKLQVAVYSLIPEIVPRNRRRSSLRQVAQRVDELGDIEKAKFLYLQLLNEVKWDPEIRDKYGRLLESGEEWEKIIEFEGPFLSDGYFKFSPNNRIPYEHSYQRLRKAYARSGIPIPDHLRTPATSDLIKANSLLHNKKYEEARRVFAELIENEEYKQLRSVDSIAVLAGYAESIKRELRILTVADWQEIYRSLFILVRDYSDKEGFDAKYSRDLSAARRQIEKLNGEVPEV
jgi:serine/threonine protein kinase